MTEEFRELCEKMVRIADALDNRAPQLANQGQALDGFSALANFRHLASQARTALAAERPAPAEPVATLHVSDFRGYENYDFQHLVDLPPGQYKLFTACTAQPPAPDPREALAARPLLEAVARLGDCIGQQTVGEIATISDRAAAWLRENPPGQPVAIEPRGCPTPGACSCVEAPAPADLSDFQTLQGIALDMVESLRPIVIPEILGVLRRAIKQHAAPAPAADSEREELVMWLDDLANDYDDLYPPKSSLKLYRAAALLREARPQLTPEEVEARFLAWWAESYPHAPVGSHAVASHVAFALHLLGGEVAA